MKTTASSLERRLRKLRCWTMFQKNLDSNYPTVNSIFEEDWTSYENIMYEAFTWYNTPEGLKFWTNIANRIDSIEV